MLAPSQLPLPMPPLSQPCLSTASSSERPTASLSSSRLPYSCVTCGRCVWPRHQEMLRHGRPHPQVLPECAAAKLGCYMLPAASQVPRCIIVFPLSFTTSQSALLACESTPVFAVTIALVVPRIFLSNARWTNNIALSIPILSLSPGTSLRN
ncbi:hypothetical protein K438DRAFT_1797384 [Mycena galopus ATCC 62051]|nr:hypothetical protein K438DRAFT_1797384 [Mycena galopus ATCC 62051]